MASIFTADDLEDIDSMLESKGAAAEEGVQNGVHHSGGKRADQEPSVPPVPELTRADKTLEELLELLDDPDFTPIIPDAVTDYYLSKSGLALGNSDEEVKIKRLLALATQKFVSDIATDAYEYSRIRSNTAVYNANNPQTRARALMMATMAKAKGTNSSSSADAADDVNDDTQANNGGLNSTSANSGKEKVTLTMEDLSMALDEHGLNVNRPQFYR